MTGTPPINDGELPADKPEELIPDRDALIQFVDVTFRNARRDGFVSFRVFRDDGRGEKPVLISAVRLDDYEFISLMLIAAQQAANWSEPAVFCPPVATFKDYRSAKTDNLREGVALSTECDQTPAEARTTLEALLGTATVVVESRGEWMNPETGEVEPKVHLHWRLKKPASTLEELAALYEARSLAATLVGGDRTNVPVVHPIRWPGSWHRKQTPRLARIVSLAEDTEIDLGEALEKLRAAVGMTEPVRPSGTNGSQRVASDLSAVAQALAEIPNGTDPKAHDWEYWNKVGMTIWASTDGSEAGRVVFHDWSAKSPKYDKLKTEARWQHYFRSPPTKLGFGSLVYRARQHSPGWHYENPMDPAAEAAFDEFIANILRERDEADDADDAGNAGTGGSPSPVDPIEPVDLRAKFDPPTLPRGLLPQVIEDFAFDRGMAMGCDMSGIAVGALAVCAAAIPDSIKLQPKKHDTEWQEEARLWVALVGSPSTMKTPMMNAAAKPLRRIDNEMARKNERAMDKYLRLPKVVQRKPPRPKQPRAMIMDTTIEAAQEILKDSPDGVLLDQDELSGWFGSMDKYSGNRGAQKDRAFWLQAYNGGSYTVSRVIRGNVHIDNLSVSILGGIQPDPIRKLADGGEDDGLLQRFIPIMLRQTMGGRDEAPGQAVNDYNDLINNLRKLKPSMTEGLLSTAIPLKFDDGALAIREELEKKHLNLTNLEGINRKLTSHFGKYNGIYARLCVVFHCIEHFAHGGGELQTVVTEDTARRVADFLHGFLKPHAIAFYVGVLGLANDHDRLANVASYILAHTLERVTNRDIQRGDRSMRNLTRRETEAIFEQLEALGWVTRTPGPRHSDPPHWVVNPVVHQKFAERAEAEKKRREREREVIADLLNGNKA